MEITYEEGLWSPGLFLGNTEVTSYLFQFGAYTRLGNRCIISGFVAVNVKGAGVGNLTIRGLPFSPVATAYHRQAVALTCDILTGLTSESIQAQIGEWGPYIYVYRFGSGSLAGLNQANIQYNSNFRIGGIYEI